MPTKLAISLQDIHKNLIDVDAIEEEKLQYDFKLTTKVISANEVQVKCKFGNKDYCITHYFANEQDKINIKDLIADCNLDLSIANDSSITINHCDPKYNLELITDAIISNTSSFSCNQLKATANSLFLYHEVTIDNNCYLSYSEHLGNRGKLKVGDTLICNGAAKATITNYGSIFVNNRIKFNDVANATTRIINHGVIAAKKELNATTKQLYNYGLILSSKKMIGFGKNLLNLGIILADQYTSLNYSDYLVNRESGIIASGDEMHLRRLDCHDVIDVDELPPTSNLVNQGKLIAANKLILFASNNGIIVNQHGGLLKAACTNVISDHFINEGTLLSEQQLKVVLSANNGHWYNKNNGIVTTKHLECVLDQLTNDGTINAQQEILSLLQVLKNSSEGIIASDKIRLTALEKIINNNIIKANEELIMHCNVAEISEDGKLIANKVVLSCNDLNNQGEIVANQGCEIITSLCDNLANGKIISAEQLRVTTEKQLYNSGLFRAKITEIIVGKKLINTDSGSILGSEVIDLTAATVNNDGCINAPKVNLKSIYNFHHKATANIIANLLKLQGHVINISGEIAAKVSGILEANKEIMVNQDGVFTGANQIAINTIRLINKGQITSQKSLLVDASCSIEQTINGKIAAPELSVKASTLVNAGIISATNNLYLHAKTLKNLYNAIIESASKMTIDARQLENTGKIEAYSQLQLKLLDCLNNLQSGQISSLNQLMIDACGIVKNAGFISSEAATLMKLGATLENYETGVIQASEFSIARGCNVYNSGIIFGKNKLQMTIQGIFNNYHSGRITCEEALELIGSTVQNQGTVETKQLSLSLHNMLQNYQSGKIKADQTIDLIGAKLVINAGEITCKNINATAVQVLENIKNGSITCEEGLNVIANLLVENHGKLTAQNINLSAARLLLTGVIKSDQFKGAASIITTEGEINTNSFDLKADLVQIDGTVNANCYNVEAKNYLQLLKNGSLTCNEASQLITQAGFVNLGKILNNDKLAIVAQEIFHDAEAILDARHDFYIKAISAYLEGDVKSSQNLFLLVENQFEYNTAKLTTNGELHLTLKDGSQVKYNINTLGDLKIEFLTTTGTWYNQQQLIVGGELTLDIPGVIFVNGKSSKQAMLQAKTSVNIYAEQADTGCGTVKANSLNTHTKSNITVNKDSKINVDNALVHSEQGKINQQIQLTAAGNIELIATQYEPVIYAIFDETGTIKQFKSIPVTNADGADALAAIYKLAGSKEVGWQARVKASQQLKEHISDHIVRKLIMEEIQAALLSDNDLYSLETIGFKLGEEEMELVRYFKLANMSHNQNPYDIQLLHTALTELVERKILDYIDCAIAKSNFWFGLTPASSGIMGAIAHINNINFNVLHEQPNPDNPDQTTIAKLCTQNTVKDVPIHNIYLKPTKIGWRFKLLQEIVPNASNTNSAINIEQPIKAKNTKVIADGKITVTSQIEAEVDNLIESLCNDVELKSIKARSGNHENFDDYILSQAKAAAGNLLKINANNIIFESAETSSGEAGTHITALANILDVQVELLIQRIQHFYEKRKSGTIRDTYLSQNTSLHKSQGNFNSFAGNSSSYYAPIIEAQEANIASVNDTTLFADVTNKHEHHEDIKSKKRRWYGGSKKTHKQSSSVKDTSKGTRFKVKKLRISGANVDLCQVHSSAERNLFSASNGKVSILQGENRFAAVNVFSSSEPLWQRQSSRQETHTTYSPSTFTGTIEIDAKSAEIEIVSRHILSFLNQIKLKPEDTIYKTLHEYHEVHSESKEGPGVALIALVALVTTIATQGAASGWATTALSGTTSGAMHAALTAGFQSIMAQAASSMVANNGDAAKALKDLINKDTLKKITTSMLSAGVMDKVTSGLEIPKETLDRSMPQSVANHVFKVNVDAGLSAAVSHTSFDDALKNSLISAVFATLGSKIDLLNKQGIAGGISDNEHTLLHAMLGGVRGTIQKEGWLAGMADSLIAAKLPKYIKKAEAKKKLKEQFTSKLNTHPHVVQDKFKTDASGRFINGEQIFSDPALIEAIIKEGKLLVGDKLSQTELSKEIHAQLKLVDLNELGNIGKELYNTDSDFRKYVHHRTAINNQAINQSDAIPLKDGYQLQPVNLVTTIAGAAILAGLAVAYMATRVSPDNTWSKLPAFEQNQAFDLDVMTLKISQHTIAAKKTMLDKASDLTDQDKFPDLCDYLRNMSSQQQAQHFTDVGYGIFQFVKEVYPLAYKTKYQETGDGIGVHAATSMYGKAAVRSCKMKEWDFEKSAKDGKIDGEDASVAGKPGSVRHDMLYRYKAATEAASKVESYDIKTGNAKVTQDEAAKKAASLPEEPKPHVYEVRPNGIYPKEVIVKKRPDFSPKANP